MGTNVKERLVSKISSCRKQNEICPDSDPDLPHGEPTLCLDLDLCSICVNLIDRIDTEKIIDIGAKACDFLGPFISQSKHAKTSEHCDALEKGELPPGIDADMVPNKICKAINVCS